MQKLVLVLLCLSCVGLARRVQNSAEKEPDSEPLNGLANLLVAQNAASAFMPAAVNTHLTTHNRQSRGGQQVMKIRESVLGTMSAGAKQTLDLAKMEMIVLGQDKITPELLLVGAAANKNDDRGILPSEELLKLGVKIPKLRAAVEKKVGTGSGKTTYAQASFTPEAEAIITAAAEIAKTLPAPPVSASDEKLISIALKDSSTEVPELRSEHILLALLEDKSVSGILTGVGANLAKLKGALSAEEGRAVVDDLKTVRLADIESDPSYAETIATIKNEWMRQYETNPDVLEEVQKLLGKKGTPSDVADVYALVSLLKAN